MRSTPLDRLLLLSIRTGPTVVVKRGAIS